MRKLTMDEIKAKLVADGQAIDRSVNRFKTKSKELGWSTKRTRPRDPDEINALNYLARLTFYTALNNGTVIYDKERRVLSYAKYRNS